MSQEISRNKKIGTIAVVLFLMVGAILFWNYKGNIFNDISAAGEGWLAGYDHRKAVNISSYPDGKSGTINGNTTLGTAGKFGTSYSFDGTGDYLSFADSDDWNLGSGDFTIDFWYKANTLGNDDPINQFNNVVNPPNSWSWATLFQGASTFSFYASANGTTWAESPSWSGLSISLNSWHHYAIVRNGNLINFYIDGISQGSKSFSTTVFNSVAPLRIGWDDTGSQDCDGSIDEVRISKGTARWTSSFTPSVNPYTADSYDKLLLHLDETGGASVYSSNYNAKKGTMNGGPVLSSKFGNTMNFDGSNDSVSFADSSDWDLDGDFTIDFWIKTATPAAYQFPIVHRNYPSTTGMFHFYIESSKMLFSAYNSSNSSAIFLQGTETVIANTWYHVAIVRNGSTATMYVNGTAAVTDTTASGSISGDAANLIIGYLINYGSYFNGSLDELRISKGIARWTSNFTPSTTPYVADSYDKLLLHFDSISGTAITSSDSGAKTGTTSGGATLTAKINGALKLDGTDDYVTVPDSPDWDFGSSDFTIDAWVYKNDSENSIIYSRMSSGSSYSYFGWEGSNLRFRDYADPVTAIDNSWSVSVSTGTWYHVAIVRSGSNFNLYLDGVKQGSTYVDSDPMLDRAVGLQIGAATVNGTYYFNGMIDELRVSKGIARWTSNFTPSTTPYVADSYDKLLLHFDETNGTSVFSSEASPILTDYQVMVGVPYSSGMQTDFDDVRFTASNGSTELPYWMESYSNDKTGTIANSPTLGSSGKFGTAYAFTGNGSSSTTGGRVSFPASSDYVLKTGTIDWWMKVNSWDGGPIMIGMSDYVNGGYIQYVSSQLRFYAPGNVNTVNWGNPSSGVWHHYALVLNGTSAYAFLDGSLINSAAHTGYLLNSSSGTFDIGANASINYVLNGSIDELRISNIPRWTSNFVPSTTAYVVDTSTKLLAHLDEASGTSAVSNNGLASFWVKASSIPSGNSVLYVYYGNSSATSASSGTNTFFWYNDKNNLANWTNAATTVSVSGNDLRFLGSNVGPAYQAISFPSRFVFEAKARFNGAYDYIELNDGATYRWNLLKYNGIIYSYGRVSNTYRTLATNDASQYFIVKGAVNDANIDAFAFDANRTYLGSYIGEATTTPITRLSIGTDSTGGAADTYIPWMFVRQYASNEPVASLGEEEGDIITFTSVSISTTDNNICKVDGSDTVCKSTQPITFNSVATGSPGEIKLYICKDGACTNCGIASQSNCWAYSSVSSESNPTATLTPTSCGYSDNQYWSKVCTSSKCSAIK